MEKQIKYLKAVSEVKLSLTPEETKMLYEIEQFKTLDDDSERSLLWNVSKIMKKSKLSENDRQILELTKMTIIDSSMQYVLNDSLLFARKAPNISLDELICVAREALSFAYNKFQFNMGNKFYTYARHVVLTSFYSYRKNFNRVIIKPDSQQYKENLIKRFVYDYRKANRVDPSVSEISEALNLNEKVIKNFLDGLYNTEISIVDFYDETGFEDKQGVDILESSVNDDCIKQIHALLEQELTSREFDIISNYFGINKERLTLASIGKTIGLSSERVRQIVNSSIAKLKKSGKFEDFRELLK